MKTQPDNFSKPSHSRVIATMTVAALGLVYGDIGTSPLYAFHLTMKALGHHSPSAADAMGIASLICWSLLITIGIKYCIIVLRADNQGEGGIVALASLVTDTNKVRAKFCGLGIISILGILGAALLLGDGIITPAISVLSAMEGITVLAPNFGSLVVPSTVGLLVVLFLAQRFGSGKIGAAFGPIMLTWFIVISAIGLNRIIATPEVLNALNPVYAYRVLAENPGAAGAVFGAVFLALTGGEAMYADMGHVGKYAIRGAFAFVVLPSLLINYFGQAALIMVDPSAIDNPFYKAAPQWSTVPLIVLATAATIIASQALITGVFSLTRQCIQLDFLPKMQVSQTSSHEFGQIYVPAMNWILAVGTLLVVVTFKSAEALGSAYGVSVAGTMLITTVLLPKLMIKKWGWSLSLTALVVLFFGFIDLGFFYFNSAKIAEGGWLPLSIALVVFFIMVSWRQGTMAVRKALEELSVPQQQFLDYIENEHINRVPGLAAWLTKLPQDNHEVVGPLLQRHLKHNKCLHERVLLLSVETLRVPKVTGSKRFEFQELGQGIYRMTYKVGFMQTANIRAAIIAEFHSLARTRNELVPDDLENDLHIFIGHETLKRKSHKPALNCLSWSVFLLLQKLASRATDFFRLPQEEVEERGIFLEI